ncbi:GAF and ANTAR domain-containing protein [Arthrobacter sp. CDRTa11]|uniref:GAF and ANTAR domain-containing protein n=1 Tax=Arthrobacter sp. CDRTa11 TaxID=2651199 RepID=UPI002265C685|nr:GAF and ANTAR domain-containing protein [Arthrobacter sp. CDRTa11]UZX04544.1 GAF and ANTAR domain-containing protein [Arthrobacter sp. CDRTa11]
MQEASTPSLVIENVQDLLLDTQDVEDFLNELARYSAQNLSSPRGEVLCGITLLRHRTAATVASSSERARLLDEIQYGYKDGPCLKCAREGVIVHVPDFKTETMWPEYCEAVLNHGIRSVLAIPFELSGQEAKAGINLYSDRPNAFDASAVEHAISYVAQASKGLSLAVRLAQHSEAAANLKAALDSRTVIDTAVGIIIAQNRCSQDEAIELIKSASSTRNVKLREVAAAIVESAGGGPVKTHFI